MSEEADLLPLMTAAELSLFTGLLKCSSHYLEFGSGGSTILAAREVAGSVTSVDSSSTWTANVARCCTLRGVAMRPTMIFADIGPTGSWGYPLSDVTPSQAGAYHAAAWHRIDCGSLDLCLIDGRFRVACFLQALLHCRPSTCIAVHDFRTRGHYQAVRQVAREIAFVDDLSVFQARSNPDPEIINRLLAAHELDPR